MDTPHTKRQEQAMARREQLVQTALRLFSEKGYRGASVRDIARAAGVNEGLLYHYFSSKGDLFRAVLDEYAPVRAFGVFLRAASAHPARYAFDDALRTFGREFVVRMRDYRAFLVAMLTEAPSDPELGAILREFLRATNDDITHFLAGYRESGQLDSQLPLAAAARVLQGSLMFHFLTDVLLAPPNLADGDKALDEIVTVLLSGFAPR